MADTVKAFPLPSSLAVVPGTEAAQAAFPYYTQFVPEDDQRFWFYNSMHFPEPMHHFDMVTAEAAYCALGAFNTRVHVLPTTKGIDHRIINGRVYIGGVAVTDPQEIAERQALFQERAFYYYEHWERLYDQWKVKMHALIAEARALPRPELPDYEPLETSLTGKGVAANHALIDTFRKQLEGYFRMWQHHFEFLLLGYGAYLTFFDFCKRAFPEISDQAISRMVAGMEAEIFRPDEEVKRLARRAVELGVDGLFHEGMKVEDVLASLDQLGGKGKDWLAELETSRDPWFNVNVGDGFYHYHRSWNDDLSMPFAALPGYIAKVKAGEPIERPLAQLIEERDQLVADYRELLDSDADRATYDQLIGLAHRVFPYVEGHKFYCEHWYTNLFFNKVREYGALLAAHGFFAHEDEIFHLTRYEVESAILDLSLAWSSGSAPLGPKHWPAIVAERKAAIATWGEHNVPPALGAVPDVIDDPAIVMLWGITRENLETWLGGDEGPSNELKGFAASNGVVEGTARVIKAAHEIGRLEQGDILVCQVTNPTWSPIFQRIGAAVSDIGGSMSHMAIVAREYGLPAVVGTGSATQRIRDGQRVRVDGGRGVVTILDENWPMPDAVAWFRDLGIGDRAIAGGKGASLGEMTRAGIAVPPGFVVTTAAFERFLEALEAREPVRAKVEAIDADDLAAVTELSEQLRRRVVEEAMPADVDSAIRIAIEELGDTPVAVRSSATTEDAEDASFAGLQDTFLWVLGADQAVARVRECWGSLYSVESITYRRKHGLPEAGVAMAVVVQRMVDAVAAG